MESKNMKRTYLFLPQELLDHAGELAAKLQARAVSRNLGLRPGAVSRAAVLRAALVLGLEALENKEADTNAREVMS
jgi:hypothetical protein